MKYTFTSKVASSDNNLWMRHFLVPDDIAHALTSADGSRRVVCRLNNLIEYQCAIVSVVRGQLGCTINKTYCKKLGVDVGDTLSVELWADTSEYGLPMPDEFKEVLAIDEQANGYFQGLTPGKKRTLLHMCSIPATSAKRMAKAIAIANHLVKNRGTIDYKQLNEEMKSGHPDAMIR